MARDVRSRMSESGEQPRRFAIGPGSYHVLRRKTSITDRMDSGFLLRISFFRPSETIDTHFNYVGRHIIKIISSRNPSPNVRSHPIVPCRLHRRGEPQVAQLSTHPQLAVYLLGLRCCRRQPIICTIQLWFSEVIVTVVYSNGFTGVSFRIFLEQRLRYVTFRPIRPETCCAWILHWKVIRLSVLRLEFGVSTVMKEDWFPEKHTV